METERLISYAAFCVSIITAIFLFLQVRTQAQATKAQLFTSTIDPIHQNAGTQNLLGFIIKNELKAEVDEETGKTRVRHSEDNTDLTEEIDRLLGRFQTIGHLLNIRVLSKRNLQPIHFEVVITGRNKAIQEYFLYLNTIFIEQTGVLHHHFEYFKALYLKMEESTDKCRDFRRCLFNEWSAISCVCKHEITDHQIEKR